MDEPAADIQRQGAIASYVLPWADRSFPPSDEHSRQIETVEGGQRPRRVPAV